MRREMIWMVSADFDVFEDPSGTGYKWKRESERKRGRMEEMMLMMGLLDQKDMTERMIR